jgi:hypothetical protein
MAYGEARYDLISSTPEYVLLNDIGGRTGGGNYMTITNAAEWVVQDLYERGFIKDGQRLYYLDTCDDIDEIVIKERRFAGFRHGGPETYRTRLSRAPRCVLTFPARCFAVGCQHAPNAIECESIGQTHAIVEAMALCLVSPGKFVALVRWLDPGFPDLDGEPAICYHVDEGGVTEHTLAEYYDL